MGKKFQNNLDFYSIMLNTVSIKGRYKEVKELKRDLSEKLNLWAHTKKTKPIILRGPRQVGKSWLAQKVGEKFQNFVEINFEMQPEIKVFFENSLTPQKILKDISNYLQVKISSNNTLLFFDEIQQSPKTITALRYFYEKIPDLHVLAAGSLLEFELRNISIPVGRVSFYYVYPLTFSEYLTALGNHNLREMIKENNFSELREPFHEKLLQEVRNYTIIGGMPEVVDDYSRNFNLQNSINIQSDILQTYITDFHKYAKKSQLKYLSKLFTTIPHQSGQKFKYSNVDKNIKSTVLGEALDLLEMAGIIYKVCHSSANGIPLGAQSNLSKFKVIFFDIGLTQRILNLDYNQFLLSNDIFLIHNGIIAELMAGLELIGYSNPREKSSIFYWHREKRASSAEIDYVIPVNNKIIPVEVKSSATGSMKSLKIFMDSKKSQFGVKISTHPYSFHNNVLSIPFYGIEHFVNAEINPEKLFD